MKPIAYEIRRTLTSKFVVIMIIAIVGLVSLLSYENASTYSPVSIPSSPSLTTGYYINGQNLTMVGYFHDAFGSPDAQVTAYYEYANNTYSSKSGTSGYANATMPLGTAGTSVSVLVNYSYARFGQSVSTPQTPFAIKATNTYSGLSVASGIFNPANKSNLGFLALYVGANGTSAPPTNLYVSQVNISALQSTTPLSLKNNSSYQFQLSGVGHAAFFPAATISDKGKNYSVVATNSSGGFLSVSNSKIPFVSVIGPLSIYVQLTQSQLQSLVFSGTSQILGFLIPILAIFAAYLTYGKDRTTGVMESVLKRPITSGDIIVSRFLSNSVAIIGSVAFSAFISDLIIHHYLNMYLSSSFDAYFIWTYVVEGLSFLALVYLFSHLAKSQGALLGASIAIFVVWDLFWSIIPIALLSAFGVSSSSDAYLRTEIAFNYASPAGYSTLIQTYFTGRMGFISSASINPALFGITPPLLITAGILWMVVPFALAYWLSVSRD